MKKHQDKNWLQIKYYKDKLSITEIAKESEVNLTTISRWLQKFRIRKIRAYKGNHKGPQNPYWGGGRYKNHASGYILSYNPNHPFCNKRGYILEHRLIIEKFMGRYLRGNEIVHHKNKAKDDNRIENLEIIVLGEPNCGEVICPFCNKKFKAG